MCDFLWKDVCDGVDGSVSDGVDDGVEGGVRGGASTSGCFRDWKFTFHKICLGIKWLL